MSDLKISKLNGTPDKKKKEAVIQFAKNFVFNFKSEIILNKISCFICHNISTIPRMCEKCNTIYCYYCSKKFNSDKKNSCGKCSNLLVLTNLNEELNGQLKNLKIRCLNFIPNNSNSCREIISMDSLIEHFNTCKFSKGYVKCMGCNKEGLYEEIIVHSYFCDEVILKCNFCNERIKNKDFEAHETQCKNICKICDICGVESTIGNLNEHKSKDLCLLNKIENLEKNFEEKIMKLTNEINEKDEKIKLFEDSLNNLQNILINIQDQIPKPKILAESLDEEFKKHLKEEIERIENSSKLKEEELKKKTNENNKKMNYELNNIKESLFQIKVNVSDLQYMIQENNAKVDMINMNQQCKTSVENFNLVNNLSSANPSVNKTELVSKNRLTHNVNNILDKLWGEKEKTQYNKIEKIEPILSIKAHNSIIYCLKSIKTEINNMKNLFVSAAGDNLIKIWDIGSNKNIGVLEGHTDQILSINEIKNQSKLLSSGEDKKIILWDLQNLKLIKIFKNPIHENRIWRILDFKYRTNDLLARFVTNFMISCSDDKTIKIFDYVGENVYSSIENTDKVVSILQYNTNNSKRFENIQNDNYKNSHLIVTGDAGRMIKVWKLEYSVKEKNKIFSNDEFKINGILINTFEFHEKYISALRKIKWKRDNFTIASASADETIKIINLESGFCLWTFKGHVDRVYSIDQITLDESIKNVNGDGFYLASGGKDKTIKIWDLENGNCVRTMNDHSEKIRCILNLKKKKIEKKGKVELIKKDNKIRAKKQDDDCVFISASSDGIIKIWK